MLEFLIQSKKKNIRVCNSDGVCFLGEVDDLISYSELSTHFNVTQGTLNTTAGINRWLHFEIDGKELFISKISVRYNITWDHLYTLGLVYGVDDVGAFPRGTPTNQLRTITIRGKTYKCRLARGSNSDPYPINEIGNDLPESQNSEWSRLLYPITSDDPNITSYTGIKLAEYTMNDLQLDGFAFAGGYVWCQESHAIGLDRGRVVRGHNGPSELLAGWSNNGYSGNTGWRPVLELVPEVQAPIVNQAFYFNEDKLHFSPINEVGRYVSDPNELPEIE